MPSIHVWLRPGVKCGLAGGCVGLGVVYSPSEVVDAAGVEEDEGAQG